jgi:hypothetical protein
MVIAFCAFVSDVVMKEALIRPSVIPPGAAEGNYHCRLYAELARVTFLQAGYTAVDMECSVFGSATSCRLCS